MTRRASRAWGSSFLLLLALVGLAGCAPPPDTRPITELPPSCAGVIDREETERCVGWFYDRMMVERLGRYEDEALHRYVDDLGQRLVAVAPRRRGSGSLRFTFRVLDEPGVQAWAAPGGFVYLTRGMLAALRSEAALAGVLAHEIGHVVAGHTDALIEDLPSLSAERLGEIGPRFTLGQDEESQADQLAVGMLIRAGLSPLGLAEALRDLDAAVRSGELEAAEGDQSWADRHPPLLVRLARVERARARRRGGAREPRRYRRHLRGLVIGIDPRGGYMTGRRYVAPRAGFSLEVPEGFVFERPPRGQVRTRWVRARSEESSARVGVAPLGGEDSLMATFFRAALSPEETEAAQVAGLTAREGRIEMGEGTTWALLIEGRDGQAHLLIVTGEGEASEVERVYRAVRESMEEAGLAGVEPVRLR